MVSNSRGGVTQQKMVPPTVVSIMVSTSTTFVLSKRRLNRKSVFTRRNEAFDKKSVSTSRQNYFVCQELKNSKKIGLHLISSIVSTTRKKLRIKAQSLSLIKNPFSLARMKDSLKNAISRDRKTTSMPPSNCINGFQKV